MSEHGDTDRLLDEYVDGTLDDLRARAVRGHLRACARCAARVAATEELLRTAAELPDLEPSAELWTQVAAGLDQEETTLAGRGRLFWWWQALGRRFAFGGGALAVACLAIWMLALRGRQPLAPALQAVRLHPSPEALYDDALQEVGRAQGDYQAAVNDLRQLAVSERLRWRPEVRVAFDQNLAAIDAAVARQVELARQNPGDIAVADALADGYKKQIDFLQEAVVRGELW